MDTQNQQTQYDPQAVAMVRALKMQESGNDYTAPKEKAGISLGGAYQYQAPTWKAYAGEVLKDPNAEFTPENQDKVTYGMVKKWKDSGMQPSEIAHMWNPGDSTYPNQVVDHLRKIAGMQQKSTISQLTPSNETSDTQTNPDGSPKIKDYVPQYGKGNEIDSTNSTGDLLSQAGNIANAVPGVKDLGEGIGTSLAYFGEKAKGLLGGKDNSKYIENVNIGKTLGGAAKVMGTAGLLAAGGEALAPLEAKVTQYATTMAPKLLKEVGGVKGLFNKYLWYQGAKAVEGMLGGGAKTVFEHVVPRP